MKSIPSTWSRNRFKPCYTCPSATIDQSRFCISSAEYQKNPDDVCIYAHLFTCYAHHYAYLNTNKFHSEFLSGSINQISRMATFCYAHFSGSQEENNRYGGDSTHLLKMHSCTKYLLLLRIYSNIRISLRSFMHSSVHNGCIDVHTMHRT